MALSKTLKITLFFIVISLALSFQSLHSIELVDAVKNGDYELTEALLSSGADVNEQDPNGETALMWAIQLHARSSHKAEMLKIIELLLQYNPDLDKQNKQGDTALAIAIKNAERSFGKDKEAAIKIVELMTSPEINISKKSCFLTFQQKDRNGAIADDLVVYIYAGITSIASPQILKVLFEQHARVSNDCANGKFTLLASKFKLTDGITPQLIVIIPIALDELGIKIPQSQSQKSEPAIDISSIENKFGFKNLTLLNPKFVASVVNRADVASPDELKKMFENFPAIINSDLPHPTRFYLDGHGKVGTSIAGIPINYFYDFLSELPKIGTEFLYIDSCHAVGNLQQIQTDLEKIITKQIEERKKSKTAPMPGIDFAIVLQAASDVTTGGTGNLKAMFAKLDKFLQDPAWALEFGPEVEKPKITISDVISALRLSNPEFLPSIRLPGKSGFFRPLNLGSNMEIVTESMLIDKLIKDGVKKTSELIAKSKSPDKSIANEAKKNLEGFLDIKIIINPAVEFIQILPIDLLDFTFEILGFPKFISKLTNQGQHFIGKIISFKYDNIKELITKSFYDIFHFKKGYYSPRCWFIKYVDMYIPKSDKLTQIKNLVIFLYRTDEYAKEESITHYNYEYAYINENGEYICCDTPGSFSAEPHESPISKVSFEDQVRMWSFLTMPSQATIHEAVGNVEMNAPEKARLENMLEKEVGGAQAVKFLEPRFARSPKVLFKMFMED